MTTREAFNRTLKVARLAALVPLADAREGVEAAATLIERMAPEARERFACSAGCATPPSDETWALFVAVLRARETRGELDARLARAGWAGVEMPIAWDSAT